MIQTFSQNLFFFVFKFLVWVGFSILCEFPWALIFPIPNTKFGTNHPVPDIGKKAKSFIFQTGRISGTWYYSNENSGIGTKSSKLMWWRSKILEVTVT